MVLKIFILKEKPMWFMKGASGTRLTSAEKLK
jgi:hypothetical protein